MKIMVYFLTPPLHSGPYHVTKYDDLVGNHRDFNAFGVYAKRLRDICRTDIGSILTCEPHHAVARHEKGESGA